MKWSIIQPQYETIICRKILRKFFKYSEIFPNGSCFAIQSRHLRISNRYKTTLIHYNIEQSLDIMDDKILRKEWKEMMIIWAIFASLTSISSRKLYFMWIKEENPKREFFQGWGESPFSQLFTGSEEGWGSG